MRVVMALIAAFARAAKAETRRGDSGRLVDSRGWEAAQALAVANVNSAQALVGCRGSGNKTERIQPLRHAGS
jgi:hypothetical protein